LTRLEVDAFLCVKCESVYIRHSQPEFLHYPSLTHELRMANNLSRIHVIAPLSSTCQSTVPLVFSQQHFSSCCMRIIPSWSRYSKQSENTCYCTTSFTQFQWVNDQEFRTIILSQRWWFKISAWHSWEPLQLSKELINPP
jgi:hypothetical protein